MELAYKQRRQGLGLLLAFCIVLNDITKLLESFVEWSKIPFVVNSRFVHVVEDLLFDRKKVNQRGIMWSRMESLPS